MHKQYGISKGFTIVELLIVVVVIAILASISLVAYTNIQSRTHNSVVQSDLRQLAMSIELYEADEGSYPADLSQLAEYGGVSVSKGSYANFFTGSAAYNYLYCYNNTTSQFGLIARSRSNAHYQYRSDHGAVSSYTGSVSTSVATMCPNIGVTWSGRIWLYNGGSWQV